MAVSGARAHNARRRPSPAAVWAHLSPGRIAFGAAALLALAAAFFELEYTARAWDSHILFHIVERSNELGVPYYVAGADHKGPLWILPYDIAYRIGGQFNLWWIVGFMVMCVAAGTGALLYRLGATFTGAPKRVVAGVAIFAAGYLMLGPEEFSHTLYSRNWLSLWMAGAICLVAMFAVGQGKRPWLQIGGAGVLGGMIVQTVPSSAPAVLVLTGSVAWLLLRGRRKDLKLFGLFAVCGLAAFSSAFAYYAVRGGLGEFTHWWWDYSRIYADSTGRSIPQMFEKGFDDFAAYYRTHSVFFVIAVLFLVDAIRRRRTGESTWLDFTLIAWYLAECTAIIFTQRFFPHYLVLAFVPVMAMAVVFAARYGNRIPAGGRRWVPAVALAWVVLGVGWNRFDIGLETMRNFEGLTQTHIAHQQVLPIERQDIRRIVRDHVPADGHIVVWGNQPFDYTDYERKSATRFIAKQWMVGEVFGGQAPDPKYILPGTWDRWIADVRQTPPGAIIEYPNDPIPADTPAGILKSCGFTKVAEHPAYLVWVRQKPIDACL